MAVEAGSRIGDSLQGSLRQHSLDLLTQGESFWRVEGVRWERYRGVGWGGGGGEELCRNGIRYPSLRTETTHWFAPIACQCLQCSDRHPPQPYWRRNLVSSDACLSLYRRPLRCRVGPRSGEKAFYPCGAYCGCLLTRRQPRRCRAKLVTDRERGERRRIDALFCCCGWRFGILGG